VHTLFWRGFILYDVDQEAYEKVKTDARKLDGVTQANLRRLVMKAVRGGMTQTDAAGTYGVSLRAVSKWMALDKARGLRALKPKRRGVIREAAA
jgi:hypothetical protein